MIPLKNYQNNTLNFKYFFYCHAEKTPTLEKQGKKRTSAAVEDMG